MKSGQGMFSDMEAIKPALHAVNWGQLSHESEEAVKQVANWDAKERSNDRLLHYKYLLEVHR